MGDGVKMVVFTGKFFPDPLVNALSALWIHMWDASVVSEKFTPDDPALKYLLPHGDWAERVGKAQKVLEAAYATYFGDAGAQLVRDYIKARIKMQWATPDMQASADAELEQLQQRLDALTAGVRVTYRVIEVPEGHESLASATT